MGPTSLLLALSEFLLITSAWTGALAAPLAPTGALISEADANFIGGNSTFNRRRATGTTSASVSYSSGPSASFSGSYQATAATDFGRNGAMSMSSVPVLQFGSGVSAGACSQWTDGFVITGGSGAGTGSIGVLLEGTLQVSPVDLTGLPPMFLPDQPVVLETASFAFSLDQTIAAPRDPETCEPTSTGNNLILRSDERSLIVNSTPFDPPRLVLSELVKASFTFEYKQPFFLTGRLTTGADVALIGGASADFLMTAKVILITMPEGATLFTGSGSYAVSTERVPFANLAARVEIEAEEQEFEVTGTFTLSAGSNGIDPLTEDVSLQVGAFAAMIPAGSFRRDGHRTFKFEGVVGGARLEVKIQAWDEKRFEFKAEGKGAHAIRLVNPVTVGLAVGNDAGSALVTVASNRQMPPQMRHEPKRWR